jgi:predicted 2-oxoglutarate/Fe(II)-dependent dioxygenase YbiX/peroxiredoxin
VSRSIALQVGEPAPWFMGRTASNPRFAFHTVAGRYVVLCLFGSAGQPLAAQVLAQLSQSSARFDEKHLVFFGVSVDAEDEPTGRLVDRRPGMRCFRDLDRSISALYGCIGDDGGYRPHTYLLDPTLRVLMALPMGDSAETHVATLAGVLDKLPALPGPHIARTQAPVLVVPRVFEPGLCQALVAYYEQRGGRDSGFMRDVDGRTVAIVDHGHKRRRDCDIEDEKLIRACKARVQMRLVPEIKKAFQFQATRMERYIVSCYDAAEAGHFNPHRDNTTLGTAHRRFAVSLFLNSGEYDGGQLRFPEYGNALFGAPLGGAVVFSCSLLHEATTVTRGKRYMFVPFLHDEAAQQVREANAKFLANPGEGDSDAAPHAALDADPPAAASDAG